jgi:S1-C subfamily serine protease
MRALPLALTLLAVALLAAACDRAAELIPGEATAVATATATPAPLVAPTPIVPPAALGVVGATSETLAAPAIPDVELARSVVQILLIDTTSGIVQTVRRGSGVVVDRDRALILTSYPLVDPFRTDGSRAYSTIAIGRSPVPGEPAELVYEAEIVTAAPHLDIAVLRAVRVYRGGPLAVGEFSPPAVRLGDSAAVAAGEALRLFGFPGADPSAPGADAPGSVTVANATLLGSRSAFDVKGRAWLDVDARLPAGVAGGPAFDAAGELVGVLSQLRYDASSLLGSARPIGLAEPLIEEARDAAPRARYRAPLQHPVLVPGRSIASGVPGVVVRGPAFAENAIEQGARLALFDYTRFPAAGLPALHYEFVAQGIASDALVEERWYLEGVLQDTLSSSYTWGEGSFAVVTDRLIAPNPNGIPRGRWELEVWVSGSLAATGLAYIGVEPPPATVGAFSFASIASAEQGPLFPPSSSAQQLLGFFEYEGASAVQLLRWVVFHDGRVVYQSPLVRWTGGESGLWWVGHHEDTPLGAGTWEIEIYLDNVWAATGVVQLF